MNTKNLSIPEDVIIDMLKILSKKALMNIFWKTIVELDRSPLNLKEKEELEKGIKEYQKGKTVKWKDLR